ncbi:hypothetical protein LXA43DRAFT_555600 [Ganoderma leucocontextum]|nr:hypothetical protein LXA43DRAFT_555600 [Ganoderma leucocontextum]
MCTTASNVPCSNAVAKFYSLPDDVVLRILLFCDIDALFACKRVCRHLQHFIDTDIYLQYKIELALNGMVDGPSSCDMRIVEKLQLLRDYGARYHGTEFANSEFKYSWQRWPQIETMPTAGWEGHLGFGGSISYIVVKPPQRQISICAPPPVAGPREMRDWLVPYEALSRRSDLVVTSVSVDLSQNLLLVAVQGEDRRHLSILLHSLDNPKEAHPRSLQPTLAITMSDELGSAGDNTLNPSILGAESIQIHENIVAWKLLVRSGPSGPCDIEVWDWTIGQRLWCSHYAFDASFTLLDDTRIVTTGTTSEELVVEGFAQRAQREETGSVLALGLPPQRGSVRIQESCIPSPPSPAEPFWTDPALRIVVVKLADESALLIPYKTFLEALSTVAPATEQSPGRKEITRIVWEDWRSQAILLVSTAKGRSLMDQWSFKHCHSYGSRVVVHADGEPATTFDLNPWAARNARRFPRAVVSGTGKDSQDIFGTKDATLRHAVLSRWYVGSGFAQSQSGLATDPMGFTEVYSGRLQLARFLGSISHYI